MSSQDEYVPPPLSDLEIRILERIASRYYRGGEPTNKQIASALETSYFQVRFHIRYINYKLGTSGDTEQAVAVALRRGLIQPPNQRKK